MPEKDHSIGATIKTFIAQNMLLTGDDFPFENDASLLEAGIIDSIGVMELVTFVAQTFKFEIPPEDITPENFDSVTHLTCYIKRKQSTKSVEGSKS
jgi:acyl carrier protein